MANTLDIIGDRWTLLIVRDLFKGKRRYREFIESGEKIPRTFTRAVKIPWWQTRFGIEAHTRINQRDYGINYGSAPASGGFDVGNEITVNSVLKAI